MGNIHSICTQGEAAFGERNYSSREWTCPFERYLPLSGKMPATDSWPLDIVERAESQYWSTNWHLVSGWIQLNLWIIYWQIPLPPSALYVSLIVPLFALKSQREYKKHLEWQQALGDTLDTLRSGYNPHYQDIVVLEAWQSWKQFAGRISTLVSPVPVRAQKCIMMLFLRGQEPLKVQRQL